MKIKNLLIEENKMSAKLIASRLSAKGISVKKYSCWGCKNTYENPLEFMRHIQSCDFVKK
jgi:hypothetical protein